MNLFDMVRRKDRWLLGAEAAEACEYRTAAGTMRAVRFAGDAELRIRDAHGALCLTDFPLDLGWRVHGDGMARLQLELAAADVDPHLLADVRAGEGAPVPLRWPLPTPRRFDLVLRLRTARALHLEIGPHSSPGTDLVPLLRGNGVEVGPGINPQVRPKSGVTVRYVEKKHPSEWQATYSKRELTAAERALWEHYVVDSARYLRGFAPGSLDFVYSHHVLEHLVDPIGTLLRWWDRLAPGGVLAGVVPDARYTFDWRQPTWTIDDVRAQVGLEDDAPTEAMYERWCRYTAAPGNTPESLRAKDYSIHVNYLTPPVLRQVLDDVIERLAASARPTPQGLALVTARNGKDFGFVLQKPRA